jgi:hypothetical protein
LLIVGCSIRRDDEATVFDLDSHTLAGREAGLFKPHAGDAQPRKKPWCSPGSSLFGAGSPAHELLDGSVTLGMSVQCIKIGVSHINSCNELVVVSGPWVFAALTARASLKVLSFSSS